MKRLTIILMAIFSFSVLNAQYIYSDFDANQNENFEGWPNLPVIVANPNPSGINTSANVAQWERSGEQWAHVFCLLDGKINFETGTIFQVKAYSPIACQVLFKLEDKMNGGISTELLANITTPNQWVNLQFNFTSGQSGLYDKLVIFFDFATTTTNTYYFDDVIGPEYGAGIEPKPYLALDVQDNFENNGFGTITNWKFQDPDLVNLTIVTDPVNASNHVADYNRSGTFEYTNAQFILDHRMDLTIRNNFALKVYFPSSNNYTGPLTPTAAIKLQNSLLAGNAWTTQTEVLQTVTAFDQWVTLNFSFASAADSMNYDQVVVQLGGEAHLMPAQFYFDDLVLGGSSGNGTLTFTPANGATGVDVTISPTLGFSVPVVMANGSPITNGNIASLITFKVNDAGGANVPFTGTINAEKTLITVDPVADLENGQLYFLALNNEVIRYEGADLIPGQNITFTTQVGQKPYLALDVQDNFENNGWGTITTWKFQDPDLLDLQITEDPVNASNHVADYNRSGTFEWTNAQFILDHRMNLTERNTFDIKVYFPSSNDYTGALTPTAAIKLQNSLLGPNAWSTQTEVLLPVTEFDSWVTLTFNFGAVMDSVNYDQMVVQLGGEGHFVPAQFYFDDLKLNTESINGVMTFSPVNQSTDVPVSVSPEISFTVAVEMADGTAITDADIVDIVSFKVNDINGAEVAFVGTINTAKTLITLDPVENLEYSQQYYLAVNNNVIKYQGGDLIAGQAITFTTETIVKPLLALDVQDNFENNGWGTINDWMFQDPEMLPLAITTDPVNAANHVADYARSGNFEWTNAQFILDHRMDLTNKNIFEIKVYLPSANNYTGALTPTVAIKLQNSLLGANAWTTQTEVKLTVEDFDTWVMLDFDFSAIADSVNYDQVVVQLGGEGHFVPAQFYFDDLMLKQFVGLNDRIKNEIIIFPNPARQHFSIEGIPDISRIQIVNLAGQVIFTEENVGTNVDISTLPKGIYSVEIFDHFDNQFILKLIKQ